MDLEGQSQAVYTALPNLPKSTWFILPPPPPVYNRQMQRNHVMKKRQDGQGICSAIWYNRYCYQWVISLGILFIWYKHMFSDIGIILWVIMGGLQVLNVMESYRCDIIICLSNIVKSNTIYTYIDQLRKNPPKIVWIVRALQKQTSIDKNGKKRVTNVLVHEQKTNFYIENWIDRTPEAEKLGDSSIVKINFLKEFTFDSDQSKKIYIDKRQQFYDANNTEEVIEFEELFQMDNFRHFILNITEQALVPWWMRRLWFWAFHFGGFGWFYRIAFKASIGEFNFGFIKEVQRFSEDIPNVTQKIIPRFSPSFV